MGVDSTSKTGSSVPHVFFFVGQFNHVDHMMPIAYKLCESNRGRPVVLVTNPFYDIAGDYRLKFLRDRYSVQSSHLIRFHPIMPLFGWAAHWLSLPRWGNFLREGRQFLLRALRKLFYDKGWAGRMLGRYRPAALVFEWANPTYGLTGAFVSAGHARGIPAFSVPHGVYIFTNELINGVERENGRVNRDYQNRYDRAVYANRLHADRSIEEGVEADRIAVLGSVRYCREWQQLNLNIQPKQFAPQKGLGCTFKVVFMLPQWNLNVDSSATIRALWRMADEPWLHLVLKPHTQEVDIPYSYLKELESLPNVEVASDIGSVALIKGTDAMMGMGTDVAIEALRQGKYHLDPAYLYDNTTLLQELGAGWQVHSDDELIAALTRLASGEPPPYGDQQVSEAIERLVVESSPEDDILMRHVDFILGEWREHPTYDDQLQANGK